MTVLVYVLSKDGRPLMPTDRCGKVRRLLKDGKARVVKSCPFTIRLLYKTTDRVQDLTLGVDTGSGTIGAAVSDSNGNIFYQSKVIVRNDIAVNMTQRAKYRRNRRNRKTRYRKARWLNRKNSKKRDRFSPTMVSKFDSHIREIEFVKSILPIKTLVFETGTFDPHLLEMEGKAFNRHWGYQRGANYGFENTRAMVLNRDGYTCQYCRGKHKDSKLEVHHIIFRSKGGSDEPENLITLCHICHTALHDGEIHPKFSGKAKGTLKYATQMNSIRCQLLKRYPEAIETFGYVTKGNRVLTPLPKDHNFDACIIASAGAIPVFKTRYVYLKKNIAKGDYQLSKGIRSEQKLPRGKICGFRRFDKVMYFGGEYFVKGRMSSGYAILSDIEGNKIDFNYMPKGCKTPKLSKCKRLQARDSVLCIRQEIIPSIEGANYETKQKYIESHG